MALRGVSWGRKFRPRMGLEGLFGKSKRGFLGGRARFAFVRGRGVGQWGIAVKHRARARLCRAMVSFPASACLGWVELVGLGWRWGGEKGGRAV